MNTNSKLNLALAAFIGLLLGVSGTLLVDKLADPGTFSGNAGNQLIEEYDPYVRYNQGIRTALGINASSTLDVSGAMSLASTFSIGSIKSNCERIILGSASTTAFSSAAATENRILTMGNITTNSQATATPYRLYAMVSPNKSNTLLPLYTAPTLATTSIIHGMFVASSSNPVASTTIDSSLENTSIRHGLVRQPVGSYIGLGMQVDKPNNTTCETGAGSGVYCTSASSSVRLISPELNVCWIEE